MTTTYPTKVVAVTSAPAKRGYPYWVAAVYELKARKDGTQTYRRSDARYAWPHRSKKLATEEAQTIAKLNDYAFWPDTRQHDTPEAALAKTPLAVAIREAEHKADLDTERREAYITLRNTFPRQLYPHWEFDVKIDSEYLPPKITVWETVDVGCRFGWIYNSVEEAITETKADLERRSKK